MVKAKFSTSYAAVRKRIQRLPVLTIGMLKAAAKRDAQGVVNTFKFGIENETLRLKRLKPATVERKQDLGQQQPETPLYGEGSPDPRALINALEIVDTKKRAWVVKPRDGYHTMAAASPGAKPVKLKVLFDVHEYGTVITNGFGRGIYIRIPPRPALRYAYRQYMAQRKKDDPTIAVRNAIQKYVARGDREALARIKAKLERGFYSFRGKTE